MEMVDFALGIVGLDICCDDGRLLGKWPWQSDEDADRAAMAFEEMRMDFRE